MEDNKYLAIGSHIAKKYEVIDILGEDDFEILYLVRDIDRRESFFVLKELFLETFSSRRDTRVYTLPEAEGVFNKRKKQIIEEIEAQKLNLNLDDIKIYGYEEDNETIYTIMEFSNNASLEKYLQYTAKDTKSLPTLSELLNGEKKKTNTFFFLKIFLIIGVILAIAFYAYKFFQKDDMKDKMEKKIEQHKVLRTIEPKKVEDRIRTIELKVPKKEIEISKPIVDISMDKEDEKNESKPLVQRVIVEKVEENITVEVEVNLTKVVETKIDINDTKEDTNDTLVQENMTKDFIKSFLDAYMESSSNASIDDTLKYYDRRVKKYFKLNDATHMVIDREKKGYNRKWTKRRFDIVDFQIVQTYKKDFINYYDIQTTTVWKVSNKRGKKLSGKSKGFMTLKELENGFKITAIYALK